uniref:CapF n=1 Tax=Capnodium sp. TTI-000886 TaxID=3078996 RepID=A0AA96MKD5_9PEZI|nr:CapF [Capnodium sp. TTI-000886]
MAVVVAYGSAILKALLLVVGYLICLGVYRLYLSPLAKIPGPKLAALTFLYEAYYDIICRGRYTWKIQELHKKYGPIVRINPREVHINDVNYYDQIYASGSQHLRNKIRHMATHDESMFDTFDAETHRIRRAAMSVSFSKRSIRALEPVIRATVEQLADRMEALAGSDRIVNLKELYSGLTMDVIGQYCFGESMDNLKQEAFGKEFLDFFHSVPQGHPVGRMFPWLYDIIQKIPIRILARIDNKLQPLADYEKKISSQITDVLAKSKPDGIRTVFHELRDSKQLPESDKTLDRFKAEATIFLGAGTETTAAALTTISYYLLEKSDRLERLRDELRDAFAQNPAEPITVAKLETLSYLTGVIQEGIRLSFGVPGRLPRIAPKEELVYAGFKLPPGTVISESSYLIHMNEDLFPDPHAFQPERWINDKAGLSGNFVPFSRGARMCIGINLAYAELYLTTATVFSRFDFELHGTTQDDVKVCHDFFVGMPYLESQGVRVKISSADFYHQGRLDPGACDIITEKQLAKSEPQNVEA